MNRTKKIGAITAIWVVYMTMAIFAYSDFNASNVPFREALDVIRSPSLRAVDSIIDEQWLKNSFFSPVKHWVDIKSSHDSYGTASMSDCERRAARLEGRGRFDVRIEQNEQGNCWITYSYVSLTEEQFNVFYFMLVALLLSWLIWTDRKNQILKYGFVIVLLYVLISLFAFFSIPNLG